jgi:OOP family OmpA-OmpF porin
MKAAPGIFALIIGCALTTSVAPVALGQSGTPSQAEITNALRPIPPGMRKGDQGLPTTGTAPLATPTRQATKTSLPVGAGASTNEPAPRASSVALLPGCTPADEGPKIAVTLPTISFEFGSARLKPESMATLQNLGKSLKEDFPATNVFLIEGHTDSAGSYVYNGELSRERAEAVKTYLTQQMGVKPEQLGVAGLGYCDLANPADPRGAENRRVVIVNKTS